MDLKQLDTKTAATRGVPMPLRHPITNEPLVDEDGPVSITLRGADSDLYRAGQQGLLESLVEGLTSDRGKPKAVARSTRIELMADCTVGWSNIIVGGERVTFSRDNAVKLYTDYPWVLDQVQAFVNDRQNYLGNSEAPS